MNDYGRWEGRSRLYHMSPVSPVVSETYAGRPFSFEKFEG